MADASTKSIESLSDFESTPAGQQKRWETEVEAAEKFLQDFWDEGDKVLKEFMARGDKKRRLNLFYSDTITKSANLSGTPKIRCKRRFADAKDDEARVSATMLERLLNLDLQRDSDGFTDALESAKDDWLKTALGQVWIRYTLETETKEGKPAIKGEDGRELAPAVSATEVKKNEDVETDWVYWRDFLYSPCRVWNEVRWVGRKLLLTQDTCVERWGETIGKAIPLRNQDKKRQEDKDQADPWARAEVWEIWDKDERQQVFFARGMKEIIQTNEDPLGLEGFFPCPKPLFGALNNQELKPRALYWFAKDLYDEAHELTRRIRGLVSACKVAGLYDRSNDGIKRLLTEACENELIPADNWSKFTKESGGLAGAMQLLPIDQFVAAIAELVQQRNIVRQEIFEITGQSDIMRGQAAQKATATEQRIKARFGAGRIQADQDVFARFASEAQRKRAEVIVKHFDAATIIQRSNIEQAERWVPPSPPPPPVMPGMPPAPPPPPQPEQPNMPLIQKAVQMLQSDLGAYRIEVDADSLSMTDYDAVQQEGTAIMSATAEFFGKVMPVAATNPKIAKFFLEMYQASISQFRGAERYESIIDRAVADLEEMAEAPPAPPPPDPKAEAEKAKAGAEVQKAQIDLVQTKADAQAHAAETQMDMVAKQQDFGMRMAELRAKQAATLDTGLPPPEGTF